MSLLRQRATDRRVESTLSARSPALARARFVRVTSCDSEVELKPLTSQARVAAGAARVMTVVAAKTSATARGNRRWPWAWENVGTDMRWAYSADDRRGSGHCGHGRFGVAGCPRCDGPGTGVRRYRRVRSGGVGRWAVWWGRAGRRVLHRTDPQSSGCGASARRAGRLPG